MSHFQAGFNSRKKTLVSGTGLDSGQLALALSIRLDLIHSRLVLIHIRLDLIHTQLDIIHLTRGDKLLQPQSTN